MFFVVFELKVLPEGNPILESYYKELKTHLEHQEGFNTETLFGSVLSNYDALFVASFADEAAAHSWRTTPVHLRLQASSREKVFEGYRLRAGPVIDITAELKPADKDCSAGSGRTLLLLEYPKDKMETILNMDSLHSSGFGNSLLDLGTYANEEKILQVIYFGTEESASQLKNSKHVTDCLSVSCMRVTRDYGKVDRNEAPEGADEAQRRAVVGFTASDDE